MLTALIIISLLSLLIATEAEPTNSPVVMKRKLPVRSKAVPACGAKHPDTDQMAA
jgi:hypothetical protein